MEDLAIEFTAGNLAGWALVTLGMPLDLLKTKLQLNRNINLLYIQELMHTNGGFFKTFYKGASSMYVFLGLGTAVEFSVFETALQIFSKFDHSKEL